MLKKLFLFAAMVASVAVFAETDFKKIDLVNVNAEQVKSMKEFIATAKSPTRKSACEIAIYAFENNIKLSNFEQIVNIAQKNEKEIYKAFSNSVYYVYYSKQFDKFGAQILKDERSDNNFTVNYMIAYGLWEIENPQKYQINFIKRELELKKSKISVAVFNKVIDNFIKSIEKDTEENAIKNLKLVYRAIVKKLMDNPELKTAATKVGLVLRSYGIDIK